MTLLADLPSIQVDEEDDLSGILTISNEFNYLTPSKCFYILLGEYTEEKRLLGRLPCTSRFCCSFMRILHTHNWTKYIKKCDFSQNHGVFTASF